MIKRKLLLLVSTNRSCKRNHALMHAINLKRCGHEIRIILKGEGPRSIAERDGRFGELFLTAVKQEIPLVGDIDGHAAINHYISEGFELVVY